jgi:hypothetical protein
MTEPRASAGGEGVYRRPAAGAASAVGMAHLGAEDIDMEKIRIEQHSFSGALWFGAWLFTIGFLHLTFWKSVLAIVLWPYYLGLAFSSMPH